MIEHENENDELRECGQSIEVRNRCTIANEDMRTDSHLSRVYFAISSILVLVRNHRSRN